ncbi:MAG: PspC domain-containing protein [Acidobacteriaceae bacterium]
MTEGPNMFCHKCGQALPTGANFCASCGAPANPNLYTASPLNTMYRPRGLRMIAGVCAAIALRLGWDLAATRIIAVILAVVLFPLTEIAYVIAWLLIPEEVLPVPVPEVYAPHPNQPSS